MEGAGTAKLASTTEQTDAKKPFTDAPMRVKGGGDDRPRAFETRPIDRKIIWMGLRGEGAEAQVTNVVEGSAGYTNGTLMFFGEEGRRYGFASFQTEQDASACIRALQAIGVPASVKGEKADRPIRSARPAPKADPTETPAPVEVPVTVASDTPADPAADLAGEPAAADPAPPAEAVTVVQAGADPTTPPTAEAEEEEAAIT